MKLSNIVQHKSLKTNLSFNFVNLQNEPVLTLMFYLYFCNNRQFLFCALLPNLIDISIIKIMLQVGMQTYFIISTRVEDYAFYLWPAYFHIFLKLFYFNIGSFIKQEKVCSSLNRKIRKIRDCVTTMVPQCS